MGEIAHQAIVPIHDPMSVFLDERLNFLAPFFEGKRFLMFEIKEIGHHSNIPEEYKTRERPKTCKFLSFSVLDFEAKQPRLSRYHRINNENPGELTQRTFCSPFKGYNPSNER